MSNNMGTDELTMVVGTYTGSGSRGLYSYRLNQETGQAQQLGSLAMENPSFLTFSHDGNRIYAISENDDDTAAIAAIDIDKTTGKMTPAGVPQRAVDGVPCHVAANGRIAVTANYGGGTLNVFPMPADGSLGPCSQVFKGHTAGLPYPQADAHMHMARFMADGSILATDFSADQLLRLEVDESGTVQEPLTAGTLPVGTAPRHIEASRDERFIYAIGEVTSTVTVFEQNALGTLDRIQVIAADHDGSRGGGDIHLSRDGRYLYASKRLKDDGICIFEVDRQSGRLSRAGYQATGIHPRHFAITPNDRLLLCACRDSDCIQVFSRDAQTGLLTLIDSIAVKKPVCIQFTR